MGKYDQGQGEEMSDRAANIGSVHGHGGGKHKYRKVQGKLFLYRYSTCKGQGVYVFP